MKITNTNILNIKDFSTQQTKKTEQNRKLSRVEEIKQQIKNGTYKVDIDKTAESMAKYLLK